MKHVKETWEVDIYISEDGRRFRDKQECENWEQDMIDYKILGKLHSMELDIPFLSFNYLGVTEKDFYLIRNEEERDAILRKWCSQYQYVYVNWKMNATKKDLSVGDWVVRTNQLDDGEWNKVGVFTLSYIVGEFSKFVEKVNNITVEGKY